MLHGSLNARCHRVKIKIAGKSRGKSFPIDKTELSREMKYGKQDAGNSLIIRAYGV